MNIPVLKKKSTVGNWLFYVVESTSIIQRHQNFPITDFLKHLLPISLPLCVISGSEGLSISDIEKIIDFCVTKKYKLVLCSEQNPHDFSEDILDHYQDHLVWFTEYPKLDYWCNHKKWHVPTNTAWYRTILNWQKYKKKFKYDTKKIYPGIMRCGGVTENKTKIYSKLESMGILERFAWSCIYPAPWLKSKTPKFFDSEGNFESVNKELPCIEQTQSYVQIVLEVDWPTHYYSMITEKTWQAMATNCPVFWWAQCHKAPVHIKRWGFDIDFIDIDSSYLTELDSDVRLEKLSKQLKEVSNLDFAKHMYEVNREISAYNYNRLFDLEACCTAIRTELQMKLNI